MHPGSYIANVTYSAQRLTVASHPFKQVDVFTSVPFRGNPVAVVFDADELTSEQMQQIANWTNLSETTFVSKSTEGSADYHVRIFTPHAELPFAGHPTIGTAHALLEAGSIAPTNGKVVQQCAAGLIDVTIDASEGAEPWIAFDLPDAKLTPLGDDGRLALEALLDGSTHRDARPHIVDVGPRWLVAQMETADAVLELHPDFHAMIEHDRSLGITGIMVFGEYAGGEHPRIEVRAFAPTHGINEDPVCGSGNGAIAAFIRATGMTTHFGREYLASQGRAVGRAGRLRVSIDDNRIRVGGNAVTCVDGRITV